MKKAILIKKFEDNLRQILTQKDASALGNVPQCVSVLREALEFIVGDEVNPQDFVILKSKQCYFFQRIDELAGLAGPQKIRGKAAYYSKTTLERLAINPDVDKKEAADKSADAKQLIEIYKETRAIASKCERGLDKKLTQDMIQGTIAYRSQQDGNLLALAAGKDIPRPSDQPSPKVATEYRIVNLDSFVAAKELVARGLKPLVVNAANKISIGGGVEQGTTAQEETLFRCSNYCLSLYPHGNPVTNGRHAGRFYYTHPIAEFGSYYSPHVQVFRDAMQQYKFIQPFSVGCLALAGYDLGKPHQLEKNLAGKQGGDLLAAFKKFTKIKIEHALEVTLLHGHDAAVLPALSCGAFRLPGDTTGRTATVVAETYKEVLEQPRYQGRFKNITFAVLGEGPIGKINFEIFQKMVQSLSQPAGPSLAALPSVAPPQHPAASQAPSSSQPSRSQGRAPGEGEDYQVERKQLRDDPQVLALLKILEEDFHIFKKLPADLPFKKAQEAVINALKDQIDTGEFSFQNFSEDLDNHKNSAQFLNIFLDCLPNARLC